MILGSLLLLSCVAYHATSTLINHRPTTSNRVIAQCFTPETGPELIETNLQDCRHALFILASTPDFTAPMRYSKNPRRGLPVPRGWTSGDCLILVSCENERDAYTFRFADVLVVARRIVDTCVGTVESPKWGLLRWGGIDELGDSQTFYVSVFKPSPARTSTGSVVPVELVNGTLLDPVIKKVSRGNT